MNCYEVLEAQTAQFHELLALYGYILCIFVFFDMNIGSQGFVVRCSLHGRVRLEVATAVEWSIAVQCLFAIGKAMFFVANGCGLTCFCWGDPKFEQFAILMNSTVFLCFMLDTWL